MSRLDRSLLRPFPLFRGLADADMEVILESAATRRVAKGATLFEQAAEADEFFFLLDGRLKVMKFTSDGDQVLIRFVVAGEVCGMAAAIGRNTYPATAKAAADCVVLAWPSTMWLRLVEKVPALGAGAMRALGQRLEEAHTRITELSTEEVQRRLANAITRLAGQAGRKVDKGILIDFAVTRQDLAEMTGTTLHTVSRIMSCWESKGLLEGDRQHLLLREPHKLLMIGEGSSADG
ncbi:Crp/Fnr family transcriptional regulator [Tianweitania sediminis]|uniref:Crp/Fnr family transcriptional regulator n=1 Tax=Tianweitania sediminis TaxID=1502156 RepID=A0A8J7UHP4_9HYPH|nr:Crp/Fnr family transcriptional regulator [Tianweitania sediminis]MBP0438033.1 Crp/Fnr family transcriptional regulator [Tianweitania sediminis]